MADKKKNRVSVNQFRDSVNRDDKVTMAIEGTELEFEAKKFLTLGEMLGFTQDVADSCVDEETGEYNPEYYDFALRRDVIAYYTNISLPQKLEDQYELLYKSPVYLQVCANADMYQFREIQHIIDKKINHKLGMMYSKATRETNELMVSFDKLMEKFDQMSEDSQKFFGDIDGQKLADAVTNLANGDNEAIAQIVTSINEKQSGEAVGG